MTKRVADESVLRTVLKVLKHPFLRTSGLRCMQSIFYNFFFLQYKSALLKRIPVSSVDHPLDREIPFTPRWVGVYLDFIGFWLRSLGFFLRTYGDAALEPAKAYIEAMDRLYKTAAAVYKQHLSTTKRPRYFARLKFIIIHTFDPHLMCIPSLHVMIVILTYTRFRALIAAKGDAERFAPHIEEVKQGAIQITQAILYIKQHSINCVAAAMYAMTRFDPALFPPEEAEAFVSPLFRAETVPNEADTRRLTAYIQERYTRFLAEGTQTPSWEAPLLAFLKRCQAPN